MKTTRSVAGLIAGVLLGALFLSSVAFGQEDDLTAGRRLFRETAGGVGCAYCHGLEGRGDGLPGIEAPNIVGAQMSAIRASLAGGVPAMGFIELNERELAAVAAYVQQLAVPEPEEPAEPAPEEPAEPDTAESVRYLTINVDITEEGYRPASISIPVGQMVQLIVRNRTQVEHHYKIVGLVPENLLWLADPVEVTERVEGVTDDEHDAHHATSYVAWRAPSPAGILPTGDEVHAWAYQYSPGGGKDVVLFAATETGIFQVVCPLHPDMVGEVTVY